MHRDCKAWPCPEKLETLEEHIAYLGGIDIMIFKRIISAPIRVTIKRMQHIYFDLKNLESLEQTKQAQGKLPRTPQYPPGGPKKMAFTSWAYLDFSSLS